MSSHEGVNNHAVEWIVWRRSQPSCRATVMARLAFDAKREGRRVLVHNGASQELSVMDLDCAGACNACDGHGDDMIHGTECFRCKGTGVAP
jgi:hypothetical protein